jgi:CHASE3 domain sensor protein
MKKNKKIGTQILAIFALFGILIGIVGTAILFVIESSNPYTEETIELTNEQIEELIEQSGADTTNTGELEENSLIEVTGETNDGEIIELSE